MWSGTENLKSCILHSYFTDTTAIMPRYWLSRFTVQQKCVTLKSFLEFIWWQDSPASRRCNVKQSWWMLANWFHGPIVFVHQNKAQQNCEYVFHTLLPLTASGSWLRPGFCLVLWALGRTAIRRGYNIKNKPLHADLFLVNIELYLQFLSFLHIYKAHETLQWRHNGRNGVSNHRRLGCLPNRLFGRRSKKTKFETPVIWDAIA